MLYLVRLLVRGINSAFQHFYSASVNGTNSGSIQTIRNLYKSNLLLPVAVYLVIQLGNFGLGLWKCNGMGLLPTTPSDWLAFLEPKQVFIVLMNSSWNNLLVVPRISNIHNL
jgi:hypothetical protein